MDDRGEYASTLSQNPPKIIGADNSSAFRQVEQGKGKKPGNKIFQTVNVKADISQEPRTNGQISSEVLESHRSEEAGENDSISGEINPVVDENSVRLFIALFDYDPVTMSPNVDCIDEELPFREGQILKVYGDKDSDGFFRGESQGRVGYIPCNMVSEVQIDDPELAEQLLRETSTLPDPSSSNGEFDSNYLNK